MVLKRYRIMNVVLYAHLRLSPTPTLQRVGDSLGEATYCLLGLFMFCLFLCLFIRLFVTTVLI